MRGFLVYLAVVALVAGACASLAILCFWGTGQDGRRSAAVAAAIAGSLVVSRARHRCARRYLASRAAMRDPTASSSADSAAVKS